MTQPLTPAWLQPGTGNLLSNNVTPTFKARYANPLATGDPVGQARFIATRTGTAALPSYTPSVVWDTGWRGIPTVTSLPVAGRGFGITNFNGRVYVVGGVDNAGTPRCNVWSAPFLGASVGTWREERPMEVVPGPGPSSKYAYRYQAGCTAANFVPSGLLVNSPNPGTGNPWLLVYGGIDENNGVVGTLIAAPINADGTLGAWMTITQNTYPLAYTSLIAMPSIHLTSAIAIVGGYTSVGGAVSGLCWCANVKSAPTGSAQWGMNFIQGPNMAFSSAGHFTAYDAAYGVLQAFRGWNGSATYTGEQSVLLSVDAINGVVSWGGSWTGSGVTGTGRSNCSGVYFPAKNAQANAAVYLFGGSSNVDLTGALNSVEYSTITAPASSGAQPTYGTWTTSSNPLPVAAALAGATVGSFPPNPQFNLQTEPDTAKIVWLGGGNGTNGVLSNVYTTTLPPLGGGDITAWRSGAGSGLVSANLGASGVVATSTDPAAPAGSQELTVVYGQITTGTTLVNADQVQLEARFIDKNGGDPSSSAFTSFKIGQPPTISSVAPSGTVTNARPTSSFIYTAGAGGSGEYSWSLQVKQGSTVIYDTGLRYDNANSAALIAAPFLAASTTYTIVVTVNAQDNPYPGSSVSATSSPTFTTSALTAQPAPTSPLATATTSNIGLAWTAASGATYYRVYYKRTGNSIWNLLSDNVAGVNYVAMDNIAIGVSYDFAISAVNATPIESAITSPVVATIPQGNYSAYLHIANAGTTYGLPLQVQGSPTVMKHRPSTQQLGFGYSAPVARYTSADYHTIAVNARLLDSTPNTLATLQALIDQVEAGAVCFWRDALGGMMTVTLDPDQGVSILPPFYREVQLKMTEAPNTVGPYVVSGSAIGYPTLDRQSKPALAIQERLL